MYKSRPQPLIRHAEKRYLKDNAPYRIESVTTVATEGDRSIIRNLERINHLLNLNGINVDTDAAVAIKGYKVSEKMIREEMKRAFDMILENTEQSTKTTSSNLIIGVFDPPLWYVDLATSLGIEKGMPDIDEPVLQWNETGVIGPLARSILNRYSNTECTTQECIAVMYKHRPFALCVVTPRERGVVVTVVVSEDILDTTKPLHAGYVLLRPNSGAGGNSGWN